ncbi:B3 domain-containing protein Os04g0386900-like [Lolium rigidum]|uniref:B3 domain-containing protein Os04g0386900-like n=1 Tax=Lolium rigidum TaxID=89674 RepID=UPI001F5D85D7|nr:B3 domain-containing protein Os04g0386900-like [Lolium rigidum]
MAARRGGIRRRSELGGGGAREEAVSQKSYGATEVPCIVPRDRLWLLLLSSIPLSSPNLAMAEPMPTDSSTAVTPPLSPSHDYSKESRGIVGSDHGVASSTGDIPAGRPDDPDLQLGNARVEAEKTQPCRIVPLSGKPYFACVLCKSHVQAPFQMVVPRSLASFLPSKSTPATLTWQGRSWEMRFTGGRLIQRLDAGWKSFALDNALRLGDGCVFELEAGDGESVVFRVQVLRAEIPAGIRERAGGYTASSPLLLD